MSRIDRREFFGAAFAGSSALFAPSLAGLATWNASTPAELRALLNRRAKRQQRGGYGPLVPSSTCPELSIPRDFRVVKVSETFLPSSANAEFTVPPAVDGMAAFALPNGNVRLIRNHEVGDPAVRARPFGKKPYDKRAGGGTTSLEVRIVGKDANLAVDLVREFPSLSGTFINCAGGAAPWGSWLSCEETTQGPSNGFDKPHGYVFEVSASASEEADPVPLKAMGRFVHEAVAIDPATGIVYLTEDVRYVPNNPTLPGSGFYRFVPKERGKLAMGGTLQMLAVRDAANYNTIVDQKPGAVLPAYWLTIDDPDPFGAEADPSAVARGGWTKGAARFQRLEGAIWGDNSVYFDSTSGGNAAAGQIWQYRPKSANTGELVLIFESPNRAVLDGPDNLCLSPRGGLVICEDSGGEQFIRGLLEDGEMIDLVQAPFVQGKPRPTEFAGSCFSPDGRVLFFNQQGSTTSTGQVHGATYALWGQWERGGL
jgi:secreted PhoX family phosphatase